MEPRKPALGIALWGTHPMPKLVEQVRIAEALGFESVWVIDSQLICRDIFVTLAACLGPAAFIINGEPDAGYNVIAKIRNSGKSGAVSLQSYVA